MAAGAAVFAVAVAWEAAQLPSDGVPLHVNASGAVDRVGSRMEALLFSALPGVVVLGLGIGLVLLVRHGSLRAINIPHKPYWLAEQRLPQLRRMLAVDVAVSMSSTLLFVSLIPVLLVALAGGADLAPGVLWVPIGIYFAAVAAWAVWLARYRYRPQE